MQTFTLITGDLLNADRTTIFIFDKELNELWAIVAKDENGKNLDVRFPANLGIAGEVATEKKIERNQINGVLVMLENNSREKPR